MKFVRTNLNFRMKFKWNDKVSRPLVPNTWSPNIDGWIEVQAWEFMEHIGPHMSIGRFNPVQTEVMIEAYEKDVI